MAFERQPNATYGVLTLEQWAICRVVTEIEMSTLTRASWAEARKLCLAVEMGLVSITVEDYKEPLYQIGQSDVTKRMHWLIGMDAILWSPDHAWSLSTPAWGGKLVTNWALLDQKEAEWVAYRKKERMRRWRHIATWISLMIGAVIVIVSLISHM